MCAAVPNVRFFTRLQGGIAGRLQETGLPPDTVLAKPEPMTQLIDNTTARRLFLERQALAASPTPKLSRERLASLIDRMGFVQVDSISTVERAHHMILFSRNQTYRQKDLKHLLEKDRALFENWTHDASIIPSRFYPYWQHRFEREREKLRERWRKGRREGFETVFDQVLGRIENDGPVMSRDMAADHKGEDGRTGGQGWWDWHPSKTALEFLWRTGELAVTRREAFQKVYDLSERVIPACHYQTRGSPEEFVDWACRSALDRLGFATCGEIAAFWDLIRPVEARAWCDAELGKSLIEVDVEPAGGKSGAGGKPRRAFARPEILDDLPDLPDPPGRVRVLSPFDPLIRDRNRTERLFGFHYRIEVFVPAARRQYGYYVFPLLERDRLIGRLDMICRRKTGDLSITGLWLEPGVRRSKGRLAAIEAELDRLRRFTGMDRVRFENGWLRDA